MQTDGRRRSGLAVSQADEPSELFPRAVRPPVFQAMWLVLAVLLVALCLIVLQYGRIT